jgi:hypothetical protein
MVHGILASVFWAAASALFLARGTSAGSPEHVPADSLEAIELRIGAEHALALKALQQRSPYRARNHALRGLRLVASARAFALQRAHSHADLQRALAIAQQLDSLDQCGEISSGEQLKTLIEAHRVVDPTLFDWSCARLSDVRESYRRALGAQLLEAVGGDPRGARLIGIWGQAESLRTQDAEAGLWLLEVAIHAAPSDPELLAACGQMLFDTGRLTEARWHLERAVAQQPTVDSLNRLRLIGELTNDQGLAQSSANHLKQLSAADPGIPPVRLLSPEAFLQSSARGEVAQLPQPWKDVSPSTFPSNRPRTRHR